MPCESTKLLPLWTRSREKIDPAGGWMKQGTHLWLKGVGPESETFCPMGELIGGLSKTTRQEETTKTNTTQHSAWHYKGPPSYDKHTLLPPSDMKKSNHFSFFLFHFYYYFSFGLKTEMRNQTEPASIWWARTTWLQPLNCCCTFMQGDHASVSGRWVRSLW